MAAFPIWTMSQFGILRPRLTSSTRRKRSTTAGFELSLFTWEKTGIVRAFSSSLLTKSPHAKSVIHTVYATVSNGPIHARRGEPLYQRDILGAIGDADDVGVCHRPMPCGHAQGFFAHNDAAAVACLLESCQEKMCSCYWATLAKERIKLSWSLFFTERPGHFPL